MGLDQYVFAFKGQAPKTPTDFGDIDGSQEIFYWRKHSDLQAWMENLYYQKGGQDSQFNGKQVLLTIQDIQKLQTSQLTQPTGQPTEFFFGTTQEHHIKQDQKFTAIALQKLSQGYHLYYVSSW